MTNCKLCGEDSELILNIDSGNFDQSIIYNNIKINSCTRCGHVFNDISSNEIKNLYRYYTTEYADAHNIKCKPEILDSNTDTLEITQKKLNHYLNAVIDFNINRKYNTIILDQFIEHVPYPNEVFEIISKHITRNGILEISCPNALLYLNNETHFPNYNFLIREHIQHFDTNHVISLANKHGFALVDIAINKIEILKNVFMPNMMFIFMYKGYKINREPNFELRNSIKNIHNKIDINIDADKYYCYGIGREFLFMKKNGMLNKTIGLIDSTSSKKEYTVDKMKIYGEDIISSLPEESNIVITAIAHRDSIYKKLVFLHGYKGKIYDSPFTMRIL